MSAVTSEYVELDDDIGIRVIHSKPQQGKHTFVFLNSIETTADTWEDRIAPALRKQQYGTLSFDYRCQGKTECGPDAVLESEEMVSDIVRVLEAQQPHRPVMCGLSIGGLFGARAIGKGAQAEAIVLINTLRGENTHSAGDKTLEASWDFPWESLAVPTLVFTGSHDPLSGTQKAVEDILKRIPDMNLLEYPGDGNSLHSEFPDEFVADLISYAKLLGLIGATK
ncbi:alpha/beta fold hydrolase [Granulosicoccus antarcticus]|uniref:AB hydrolase-1 domain-containing protein n=1 Tax=Granulosicoccus antarcticus IMCC3135 TaxID=1192854 RepID=A0A2Z2NPS1_9GAMM|nr:alpha/beta hydrolase [Granulosicoccus antarcticus]ASJ70770.1 hypothetical protein IMCC3135_03285 [Granulosicoccus antarcticus IMCC3135]